MLLQGMILLSPGMAITMGTWSAEHHYGVRLEYTESGWQGYTTAVWRCFRGGMAWLVVPVLVLLAMSDLIGTLPISDQAKGWTSLIGILLFVPLGFAMAHQETVQDGADQRTGSSVGHGFNAGGRCGENASGSMGHWRKSIQCHGRRICASPSYAVFIRSDIG